jgi:hypothetical protein
MASDVTEEAIIAELGHIDDRLREISETLKQILAYATHPPRRVAPGPLNPLLSGSWPRKDGTGYDPVHGDADHPPGDLRPPDVR